MRRECLDHITVLGERQLRQVVANYVRYYKHTQKKTLPVWKRMRLWPAPFVDPRLALSGLEKLVEDFITSICIPRHELERIRKRKL